MKRNTLLSFFALAALFMLSGCNDEDSFGASPMRQGNHTFVATIEGQDADAVSRTAVDENGNVSWIDTDALGVYAAHTENAKFISTGNGASVSFTGNLSPSDETAEWAYYPYDPDAVLDDGTLTFTLPSEYTYTGNSNAPMLGIKASDGNFEFKHLCGLLRITLGGGMPADADRFVITSVGDDAPSLAGTAIVNDVTAEATTLALKTENDSRSVTYHLDGLRVTEEYQNFFVPLPVGMYSKLQVAFYLKDKTEPEFRRTLSNLQVARAIMTSLPVLNWRTGEQFILSENTKEITKTLAKYVSVVPEENTTLIYTPTVAAEVPEVGSVVWSRVSDEFPCGFLGKVAKVTANENGSYTVETGMAALSEAFDELYVDETVELEPEDAPVRSRAEEMKVFGFNVKTESGIKVGVKGDPIWAQGNVKLGCEFTASIILNKKEKIERAVFTLAQATKIEFGLGLDGTFYKMNDINVALGQLKFKNIPLAYGLIQLTPVITPYFFIEASGNIKNEAAFSSETITYIGAEYKDGEWHTGQNKRNKAKGNSPWNFRGHLTFAGEVETGLNIHCEAKLYNNDKMKISLKPELKTKLTGEVKIDETNSASLEKILNDVKLATSYVISAKIGVDASLISFKDPLKVEINLLEIEFGKKELCLLPFFRDLLASVKTQEEAEGGLLAQIETESSREMLSKDTKIAIEVKNSRGEVVNSTTPEIYTGSTDNAVVEDSEELAPETDPKPIKVEVGGIQADEVYETYPVIYSPLLEDIVPEGKLELKSQTTTFEAPKRALREQLVQLYKDTDGDNWTNNENWCSDYPIESWYGVENMGDGFYRISLRDNNLNGTVTLFDNTLKELDIDQNKQVKTLILNGCESLETLFYDSNALEHLEVAGCKSLSLDRAAFHTEAAIKYLDVSECVKIVTPMNWQANMPNIETLIMRKLPDLEELVPWVGNSLQTLDISDCTKLKKVGTINSARTLRNLNISNCSMLSSSAVHGIINESPVEILKLDDYKDGAYNIVNSAISPSLIELSANNCDLKGSLGIRSAINLKKMDLRNNPEISSIYIEGAPLLADLNLEGNLGIKYASIKETALASLDLNNRTVLETLQLINNPLLSSLGLAETSLTDLVIEKTALASLSLDNQTALKTVRSINNPLLSSLSLAGTKSLIQLDCWGNRLTSLNVKGCDNLETIVCTNELVNTLDLSHFTKLNKVQCDNNKLSVLNLEGCNNLTRVSCEENELTELNVKGCTALQDIICKSNRISEINLDDCKQLISFNCSENQLKTFDVSHCLLLEKLECDNNQLTALNIKPCVNLLSLSCLDNQIEELDVLGCPSLSSLRCHGNRIKVLDLHGLAFLESLFCSGNPITVLNISGTGLTMIPNDNWNSLPLESLDVSNTVIPSLSCPNPTLKQLNIRGCSQLNELSIYGTQLTSLDISDCGNLTYLNCSDNVSLAKLIMSEDKNSQLWSLYAVNTKITSEIYDWLKPLKNFYYEQRYEYYEVEEDGKNVTKYKDKSYGWWYPGEPSSGRHSR